ncbi:MAG: hypothetical protein GVY12_11680 [Bacteroidetes bacterium]|jgi:hypothetical protein|nr:hypothetical protein [Bacteroidota bacterium]
MNASKREWTSPSLAIYGDVEAITTASKAKNFDGDDGFTLEGDSIGC